MPKASHSIRVPTLAIALLLLIPLGVNSQTRDKFVISAKAGGINAVTGRASVHGRGTSEWEQLTIKEDLQAGDVVKTGLDGRVEMLLNPGSYFRVGEESEFELTDNSLENLEVRLLRGTAIVEATGADGTELLINITTPDTKLAIVQRGLYRVNVVPGDGTELIVRKGRVMLGDSRTKIKGGNKVVFSSNSVSVAKLQKAEKKQFDTLDTWSKERAETVAAANKKIRRREVNLLMASMNDRWFRFRTSGFWYFSPSFGCYTFLPLYYGWGSPYGDSYSSSFYGSNYFYGNSGYGVYGGAGGHRSGSGGSAGSAGSAGSGGAGGSGATRPSAPPSARAPMAAPRNRPAAAERKIQQLNDRMPNK